jgi:hypothetical protein
MDRMVVEIQSRSGRHGDEKILVPVQEIKFNISQLRNVNNQTVPKYFLFLPSPAGIFLSAL